MFRSFAAAIFVICFAFASAALAQSDQTAFPKNQVPATGTTANDFAPPGWVVEEAVKGDLNGDGRADLAIKLIEAKKTGADPDTVQDRQRALVIALAGDGKTYSRAALADGLLQCTSCGGAFYGVVEAPADVSIKNGVLIVNQDHGSRDVEELTFKIRFDPASSRFILIGFDSSDNDRVTGDLTTISINFLTGVKINKTTPHKGRATTAQTKVSRAKRFIEDLDETALEAMDQ